MRTVTYYCGRGGEGEWGPLKPGSRGTGSSGCHAFSSKTIKYPSVPGCINGYRQIVRAKYLGATSNRPAMESHPIQIE